MSTIPSATNNDTPVTAPVTIAARKKAPTSSPSKKKTVTIANQTDPNPSQTTSSLALSTAGAQKKTKKEKSKPKVAPIDIKKSIKNRDESDIQWLEDLPYGNAPKKLKDLKNGEMVVCPYWKEFENPATLGYTLYDETGQRWWSDSATVRWLANAEGCGYGPEMYCFVIKKVKDKLHYGFKPKVTEPGVDNIIMDDVSTPDTITDVLSPK